MNMYIDFQRLDYADLVRLGKLAAEALALAQEYDQTQSHTYCKLIAACNDETLARRQSATRRCGTAA
jgi:hypothetical protein